MYLLFTEDYLVSELTRRSQLPENSTREANFQHLLEHIDKLSPQEMERIRKKERHRSLGINEQPILKVKQDADGPLPRFADRSMIKPLRDDLKEMFHADEPNRRNPQGGTHFVFIVDNASAARYKADVKANLYPFVSSVEKYKLIAPQ